MIAWLRGWLLDIPARRPPDFIVGGRERPYLERWWLLPRNPIFNLYLHRISRSDDDRALHDHPWCSMTWMLDGSYTEVVFRRPRHWREDQRVRRIPRRAGDIVFRRSTTAQRLEVCEGPRIWPNCPGGAMTLFVTGPVLRSWGFYCPQGWRHWRAFVSGRDSGQIGAGCGEP